MPGQRPYAASLVIGGTGMLAVATRWLMDRSDRTLVAARRASRLTSGLDCTTAIDVDWTGDGFERGIKAALAEFPRLDRALLWLHDPAPILPWLLPILGPAQIVLVLGSMDGRPENPQVGEHLATVRLGSVPTAMGRRWLTHEEISEGAISALKDGQSRVVGELAPA